MLRREFLTGAAMLPLAGCGGGVVTVDPKTIDIVQLVSVAARGFCGFLPTAETIAKLVLALALPVGAVAEEVAAQVAHAFCDALPKAQAQARLRGGPLRAVEPGTGRAIVDYGPAILRNGKVVNISCYTQ